MTMHSIFFLIVSQQNEQEAFINISFDELTYVTVHSVLVRNYLLLDNHFFYCELLKMRHNLLHYCVLQSLGKFWEHEQTVRDKLSLNDDCELLNKTPDIIYKSIGDGNIYLIDVSISIDVKSYKKIKLEKYIPICLYLKDKYNYESDFLHINVDNIFSNLEKQLNKIQKIQTSDFNFQFFHSCIDIIQDKIKWVSQNIDKEYFEKKKSEFKLSDSNLDKIGIYSDVDIDVNVFLDFNKKFTIIDKIDENLKTYNEDNLSNYLKNILENEDNVIYKMYCDKICDNAQFIKAEQYTQKK